ncbi:MAG: hypothetical protein LBB84_02010 [Tannerellaceae bacterium]|jgi:hypothetical protein|nr:hypothetical protein [Tannerellaceae bacterium]
MKKSLKFVLLLLTSFLFLAGCSESSEEDEYVWDGRVYFNTLYQRDVDELVTGHWKTLPDGLYMTYAPYATVINADSIYSLGRVQWEKNDHGFAWTCPSDLFAHTVWMITMNEGRDTLHYTSPEYPPLHSWDAVRISPIEFEEKRQEVLLDKHLRDAACPPEAVSGAFLVYDILGRWQLIKDAETGADESCREIIYDFRPDSTLVVTNRSGEQLQTDYTYEPCIFCDFEAIYHPEQYSLTIDGKRVRSEVLEKIMFLGDEENPSAKVFVRIH